MKRPGEPYRTDEGHYIVDAYFSAGIDAPADAERTLRVRPGVVETGLFLGFSAEIIVGHDPAGADELEESRPPEARPTTRRAPP
jgi:ribose 5-phosphate isomerase A